MARKLFITIIVSLVSIHLAAQNVELSAPSLSNKAGKLYYFTGAKVDSLVTTLDRSGKAKFTIPKGNYQGMAALVVPGAGGIELVVSEPSIQIECNAPTLNVETAVFPYSTENHFIKHIFTSQSRYLQQQAWLKSGIELFGADSPVFSTIQLELKKVEDSMVALDKEISASKLYAAKYFRLSEYMNRLFEAEQKEDSETAVFIRKEMEESLDITSLYTSGRLWESVLNFYASLFNHTVKTDTQQQEYAASVLRTAQRLSAPFHEAYISGCIVETERFGWRQAQDSILVATGAYSAGNNKSTPEITGLSQPDKTYPKTLIAFYDSDCGSCVNEMFRLITFYPQLQEKNIRVVSVSADMNEKHYEEGIRNFPWQDKLCDFEGFSGKNFSNYNVIGTPSFFLIDEDYQLLGQFYSVSELEKVTN